MLLTADSHSPPKCGARSGMNLHSILLDVQNSEITIWELLFLRSLNKSCSTSSRSAPMKLVPWSLHMSEGRPLRLMKRRKVAIKASVVRSDTSSRCTALTVKDTNRQTYALTMIGFLTYPYLILNGPA